MYRYIEIEDLVVSAFVELLKYKDDSKKISLQTLAEYGAVIVRLLTKSGQDAILLLSKESTYEFVHDYSEYFMIKIYDNVEFIELKDNVTIEQLRNQFRKNLTVDLAKALTEKDSLEVLERIAN